VSLASELSPQPCPSPGGEEGVTGRVHVFLDLSRLLWRAERFAPTGIDRVELAYAKHLLASASERVSFAGHWGRLGLLPDRRAAAFIRALDAVWSGAAIDNAARERTRRLARRLRAQILVNGDAPLYRRARARGGAIVYLLVSHHGLVWPAPLVRFKRRTGARLVCLVHDLIPISHPQYGRWGDAWRHRRRMDAVARLADGVVVNSAGTAAALEHHLTATGRRLPIRVAPLGLDLPLVEAAPAARSPYFVCVATIEPRKNHRLLLDVWRRLAARDSGAPRLALIGRRGRKSGAIVAEIVRPGPLQRLVDEHNALPDAAVARLVAGAKALLYPSFAEGFGLPVAEALALGVPVLCSDLAELRELGRDVPEYLDPRDRRAWHQAVLDYAAAVSPRRGAQLARLGDWRPPSWEAHFRELWPFLDRFAVPTKAGAHRQEIETPGFLLARE
jgi:glycosyltransferase involved in cell wall biosynthesis